MGSQVPGVPDAVQIHPSTTYLEETAPVSEGLEFQTLSPTAADTALLEGVAVSLV